MDKARVKLDFFGQIYDLKADDREVDVREVVEYVHEKTREQEEANRGLPPHKLIVLAVLNMGRDYVLMRSRLRELEASCASHASRLATKIDTAMKCNAD